MSPPTQQAVSDVRLLDGFDPQLPPIPGFLLPAPHKSSSNYSLDRPLSSLSSATENTELRTTELQLAPEEEEPAKPKRSFRRSKTAEEKAARVKARNRRAQQAFRSRQKALHHERAQSLEQLQTEVSFLRQANGQLVSKVEELTIELASLKYQLPQSLQCIAGLEGLLKQEVSDTSENLQSVCPLVMGMIPNDSLSL